MFGSAILEACIGLILVYLMLSLICTSAKEGLESLLKKRAIDLERGIKELLGDREGKGLTKALYEHPLIDGLFQGNYDQRKTLFGLGSKLPSYIPAWNFAQALMDLVMRGRSLAAPPAPGARPDPAAQPPQAQAPGNQAADALERFRAAVDAIPNDPPVKRALRVLADAPGADINQVRADIEAWFNNGMDRVSGWYKRWTQWVIFFLGLLLVVVLNADTIRIGNSLAADPALRQSLTAAAAAAQDSGKRQPQEEKNDPEVRLQAHLEELRKLGLPIGWDQNDPRTWPGDRVEGWLMKGVGLLATALAITLGAPFWFEVLNKFMFVRSSAKPKAKSPKEEGGQ